MKADSKIIYIELLDEGLKVWKPVEAIRVRDNVFIISEHAQFEEGEIPQFSAGMMVEVDEKEFDGRTELIAIREIRR